MVHKVLLLRHRHLKHHPYTVDISRAGTHCDQGVHVRREVYKTPDASREETEVYPYYCARQQKLKERRRHRVAVKEVGDLPSPHGIPHGKIHENEKKHRRAYQTLCQRFYFFLFPFFFCAFLSFLPIAVISACAVVVACAVSRLFNSVYYFLVGYFTIYRHVSGKQRNADAFYPVKFAYRLFNSRLASGTAHTGNIVSSHIRLPSFMLSPSCCVLFGSPIHFHDLSLS